MSEQPTFPVHKPEEQWRNELTPQQFQVLREHGTERPGSSPLNAEHRAGVFRCAACGHSLFESQAKYDSRSGWPSFFQPLHDAIGTSSDNRLFMRRTEVHCARCGGHLGHVFADGPEPTGLRYCINGVSLRFDPA